MSRCHVADNYWPQAKKSEKRVQGPKLKELYLKMAVKESNGSAFKAEKSEQPMKTETAPIKMETAPVKTETAPVKDAPSTSVAPKEFAPESNAESNEGGTRSEGTSDIKIEEPKIEQTTLTKEEVKETS